MQTITNTRPEDTLEVVHVEEDELDIPIYVDFSDLDADEIESSVSVLKATTITITLKPNRIFDMKDVVVSTGGVVMKLADGTTFFEIPKEETEDQFARRYSLLTALWARQSGVETSVWLQNWGGWDLYYYSDLDPVPPELQEQINGK